MVQLLEVITEVTEEMQWEEELKGADLVKLIHKTVYESPEQSQWLAQSYQPEVYAAETNQVQYVEAIILG